MTAATTLIFRESDHSYWFAGQRVWSVTQAIEAAGLVELFGGAEQLAYARDLGGASHLATELSDTDNLDEKSVAPEVAPYLAGWRRFRAESAFECLHIELRLHHPTLHFAGTLDRMGLLRGKEAIIDLKTGVPRKATGIQLSAYRELAVANGLCRRTAKRYACHLSRDGTYQLVPYSDPRDWVVFAACLTLARWKSK